MEKEKREAHLEVLKKELDWLKKEKENQIKKIEKRIFAKRREAKESQMVFARYALSGILSLLLVAGPLYYFGHIDNDYAHIWVILITIVGGIFFGEIYHKIKEGAIADEAERVTKEYAADPKNQLKEMSKEEIERQKIIEKQIKEREDAIELSIRSNRLVDVSYRLDIPDIVIDSKK